MGFFDKFLGRRPSQAADSPHEFVAPPPRPEPRSPAERRTMTVSDVRAASMSTYYDESYPIPTVSEGDHAHALLNSWVANRPERECSVFLFAEPDSTVTIREADNTVIGLLSNTESSLYHPLLVELSNRGLTGMAGARFSGGTGNTQRVRLKLALDAPQVIAKDFDIPIEAIAPLPFVVPTKTTKKAIRRQQTDPPRVQETKGPPPPWRHVPDGQRGHDFIAVVGESHYQETLTGMHNMFEMIGREDMNFEVLLRPEPTNEHDSNAVAVAVGGGETVGYLSKDLAEEIQRHIVRFGEPVWCPARLVGGGDKHVGVVLDFIEVKKLKTWDR